MLLPDSPAARAVLQHPGSFALGTLKAFRANQGLLLAGAVAYYALLSIVPLLILSVIALSHLVDAEEERIENGEQHRHHAKSDGHRYDDGECGERRLGEGAQRVLNVANGVVDDRGAALVAAAIGRQRRRSEARLRAFACLCRRHPFIDQLSGFALDVEGELLLELLLDAVGPEQRTCPQFQVVECHANFITRPMAFAMRSHSRASTAS